MLLRISLGLAILVGLVTLYVSHFQVAEKITTITADRDKFETEKNTAETEAQKAKTETKTAKSDLDKVRKEFIETTNTLAQVSARATEQEKRANTTAEALNKVTEDRNDAQRELSSWKSLGVTIDAVRVQRDELRKSQSERDAFIEENKVLARNNRQLKGQIDELIGPGEKEVELPVGLKGKIVAVDPKYDFVVLDIGQNQGVLQNGKMIVNRNGKLIAKVKVTSVQANRSIANVIKEWKNDEIVEGDQVLY